MIIQSFHINSPFPPIAKYDDKAITEFVVSLTELGILLEYYKITQPAKANKKNTTTSFSL